MQKQAGNGSAHVMSWESEKSRILAALETETAGNDPAGDDERLRLEEVVQKTDRLLASKDHEINHLQDLLANQSGTLASVAVAPRPWANCSTMIP